MHSYTSRLSRTFIVTTLLIATLAHAAPTITATPSLAADKGLSALYRRGVVQPEDEDYAEESQLMAADDAEEGGQGALGYDDSDLFPTPIPLEGGAASSSPLKEEEKLKTSVDTGLVSDSAAPGPGTDNMAGSPTQALVAPSASAADSAVTAWMRPDRIKFDGVQAPFVVPGGDDVTWYKIGAEEGGATTIAAQQVKEITNYLGDTVTATIGDVMIFQDGAIAEAIGSVMPDGKRGELYNIIACNVQTEKGKCIMVDYDGTDVKETLSKIITGSSSTVAVADPTGAPPALSKWAANVMVLDVATVTAAPSHRRRRSQSSNRL